MLARTWFYFTATQQGLKVVAHPDYNLGFVEGNCYLAGENFPLKWNLYRRDAANTAVPTTASIIVRDNSGAIVTTITPDVESSVPAAVQVLAGLWSPSVTGLYTAEITIGIGTDTQIRSDRTTILIS